MATRFQRRNAAPILLDIPTFDEVGRSAYVDLTQSPIAMEMAEETPYQEVLPAEAAPAAAPAAAPGGLVPVPPATISPEVYQERAMADIQRMEAMAERQLRADRNPLNVVGSILGGVVGLPFGLLNNALGGGRTDLSAPFRPNQNAQERYQAALSAIGQRRNEIDTTVAGLRASQANAINAALTNQTERQRGILDRVAILATNAGRAANPSQAFERGVQILLADQLDGSTAEQMGIADLRWSPDLARSLGTSDDVQKRLDDIDDTTTTSLGDGTAVITDNRGNMIGYITRDGQRVDTTPQPQPQPQPQPTGVVPPASVPRGSPTAPPSAPATPPIEDIDAELRRRGVLN